jgi:hypothetical protein
MAEEKKKNVRYVTPVGIASWPKLVIGEPDTKFDEDGSYGVKLLLDPEKDAKFLAQLDEMAAAALVAMKEANPKHAKVTTLVPPYAPETDKEGEETGKIVVNFTMPAVIVRKKDKKRFTMSPKLFDAKGTPLPEGTKIGGGSSIQVSFESWPYFSGKDKEAGITRRLVAVRVLDLKVWSGSQDASDFGFDVADGFAENTESGSDEDTAGDDF